MMRGYTCQRTTDCAQCQQASEGVFVHRHFLPGKHFPADRCTQNCMLFLLNGEVLVNSQEYPGTNLYAGQFILQAIDSKIELLVLSPCDYILYWFKEPPQICLPTYNQIIEKSVQPTTYSPLAMSGRLKHFLEDLMEYLEEGTACAAYIELKTKELMFLLTCYYPLPQLCAFFYPISIYTESFQYFVMQNYLKVKTVEELAHVGGYALTTFRRLFRNMYGMPAYEWILERKRTGILDDLKNSKDTITAISVRYGFESLSHFAHFCKSSFGSSPRALRQQDMSNVVKP